MNTQTKAKLCLLSTAVIWGLGFVGVQGALMLAGRPSPCYLCAA